ncbi:MAG: glycosyltransferase family 39 protein [Planctomycetes bacterium]|nr:glycosyltransferase family 39 protein [Planctomycetota bacterium]
MNPASRSVLALAVVWFALGALWLGSEGAYHGDERFYTDAVLRMRASSDWFTPQYADGTVRLNKPLLVYWMIGASFEGLGVSLFAARLPFLAAGALVLLATARLAHALFPQRAGAPLLAAAIAACNGSLFTLASRSTPDIVLVLGVACALVGLADLLVRRLPGRDCAPWMWGGIALAAAAKGSLALVVLGFVVVAVARSRRDAWRDVLHVPSLLASLLFAAVSLAPLWLADAPAAGSSFVADQVATRLADSPAEVVQRVGEYLASTARHLLPWSLGLAVAALVSRKVLAAAWREHGLALKLVLAFSAVVLAVFAAANLHRGRYLAPLYPAHSAAIAGLLLAGVSAPWFQRLLRVCGWAACALASLAALALVRVDAWAAASCAVASAAAFAALRRAAPETGFAFAGAAVLLAVVPALRATAVGDAWRLAARAERLDATLGFDPSTPNLVRVLSAGRLDPRPLDDPGEAAALEPGAVVLATKQAAERLSSQGWSAEPCGVLARRWRGADVQAVLAADDANAKLSELGEPVFLLQRERPDANPRAGG